MQIDSHQMRDVNVYYYMAVPDQIDPAMLFRRILVCMRRREGHPYQSGVEEHGPTTAKTTAGQTAGRGAALESRQSGSRKSFAPLQASHVFVKKSKSISTVLAGGYVDYHGERNGTNSDTVVPAFNLERAETRLFEGDSPN
jgi:hypothetical protein